MRIEDGATDFRCWAHGDARLQAAQGCQLMIRVPKQQGCPRMSGRMVHVGDVNRSEEAVVKKPLQKRKRMKQNHSETSGKISRQSRGVQRRV